MDFRIATALFRAAILTLPRTLRDGAGPAMVATFQTRQRDAFEARGLPGLTRAWAVEFAGVLRTAVAARRSDPWTRRTARLHAEAHPAADRSRPPHPSSPGISMDHFRADVSFALRTFLRRPGLAVLSVLTLSLGVGASTAMYSVVESVLLRPLPYPEADRLVSVYPAWPVMRGHPTLGNLAERGTWSWPEYFGVRENQEVFDAMAAYEGTSVTLQGEGPAERVRAAQTTWELFPILGAVPAPGRLFTPDDRTETRTVVLSHGFWRDRLGGDPDVVGRTLRLDDESWSVVGVLPPGLRVHGAEDAQMWLPRTGSMSEGNLGNHGGVRSIARLAPGIDPAVAAERIGALFDELLPEGHGEHDASVFPRHADETDGSRGALYVMLGASLLLLLVACGNVAALLLGAGLDRERELAVRGAVGASRGRVAGQLLTESTVIGAASVLGGIAIAYLLKDLLLWMAPAGVPGLAGASIDGTVLLFAAITALLFGVGFGLIPALALSKIDLASAMGTTRTSGKRSRLQAAVVVGELALATVLVVSGLLLTRTVAALGGVDTGFDHERLAVVEIGMPWNRFRGEDGTVDSEAAIAYRAEFAEAIATLPGVESVVQTSVPPLTNWRGNNGVWPEGWDPARDQMIAERRFVSEGFFRALGIELVAGRPFAADDYVEGAPPVVVVSQGLAEMAWPGENPIGKAFNYWAIDATVVGVASDVRDESLEETTRLAYYAPRVGFPFVVRAAGDPSELIAGIRSRVASTDPDVPIILASPMSELIRDTTAERLYRARLMAVFAGLAGFLAVLGIYGVTARSVARRTREMGIRVALGADRRRVRGLVTLGAVRLAVFGVLLGILASVVVGGVMEEFLWGVSRTDPWTLGAVALALPVAAALAAVPPARRATRVDPLEALKAE